MAVNITTDTSTVKVLSTTNTVKVIDNRTNTTVHLSQPSTKVIKVATVGPQGQVGIQGIQGAIGIQGPAGSGDGSQQGVQGIQGIVGAQGTTGIQGIQGTVGIQGPQGVEGIQGIVGMQGTEGIQGAVGEGIQGPQGIEGIQGITGAQGVAGSSGTSIDTGSFATTSNNTFTGNQIIQGGVSASYYNGDARYLNNLPATTNWNYNQEFEVKNTEQLTFSGDYILENTYLYVEGGIQNSIGEWTFETWDTNATYTANGSRGYTITGPTGDTNASVGIWMHRQFDANTTMSIDYVWNGEDVGNDWPIFDIQNQYPSEISTENRLQDRGAISESGTWTINVPSGSWLAIGVNTANVNTTVGTLQITLPYLPNVDNIQYSSNKYFKKQGTIFIGGNLLVKDSYINNNGHISVGGEVILIGNSQIVGTGTII